jgi:hypothetical protein
VQRRKAENQYEKGEAMSDQTHLLERIVVFDLTLILLEKTLGRDKFVTTAS